MRLEAFENVDAETAKFQDYVSSKEIDQNYVELYRKEHCEIHWLCLMVFGDSGTGKTTLIHRLLNKPDSESTNTGKLEVTDCIISGTDTPDPVWKIPRFTFHERVKENFQLKFPDVMSSEGGLRQSWVESGNGDLMENSSLEVKIWDVSSNWGAHNSHKVFLTPSSVCLLTLNVGYGLHTPVRNDSGNERSMSPLESLDHWLQMIDMSTNYDSIEYHLECTVIVLTHTDLIDEAHRERKIEEYKEEIKEHVQSKYTCKYVDPTIFVVGNSEIALRELRKVIVDKGKSILQRFEKKRPLLWLKLQSDIGMFCQEKRQKYMSLNQVRYHAEKSYDMPIDDLKDFLRFHLQYRSLLFDPLVLNVLESIYCTAINRRSCLLITDPCFIDDAFKDIIFLWKNRVFPKSPNSSLNQTREMNLDFKRNLISLKTLTHLWADFEAEKVETLATILVRFHMLIPDTSAPPVNNNKKYFVPGTLTSLTGVQVVNSLQEFSDLPPLIYWFDRSPDPAYRGTSGFPTGIFFCKLVTILKDITPKQGTWKLRCMFSDGAIFRVGPEGQVYVHISSKSCAIVTKLACLPNSMPEKPANLIQDVRFWIELGIQVIIQDVVPGLGCSVYVSPCGDEFTFDCLERLGALADLGGGAPGARPPICLAS